jgi:hypothetical protein
MGGKKIMDNLRKLIEESQWKTQERFASVSGINEGTISKYCRGLKTPIQKHKTKIEEMLLNKK